MKITKFNIENYRAIEKVEVNLNFSINPIVGVNESGKTSVLRAILCFDKTRDRFFKGEHLEFQNKYSPKDTKNSNVSATLNLDKLELESLIKNLKLTTDSEDYKLIKKYNTKTNFVLTRSLSTDGKPYIYSDELLSKNINSKIAKYLSSHIPFILYFDDFADRVPDIINFPPDYKKEGKLNRNKLRDWQEIIEEVFKRADNEGLDNNENPLQTYMGIEDTDRKDDILSDIEDELNKEIIKEWKRIKKSGTALADDSDKLELKIINKDNNFEFKVRDKSYNDRKRTFNISDRSKGFQWFFNYMIKLKFNPNYQNKLENSIFLLDEPGSYLHSAAQSELLNELKRVSENNHIIYCTHSQYLLNPDIIKLGSIKIADKSNSKISLQEYGRYKGLKDKSALSPIYQALQLNFAHDIIGKIVITEGITDYYLLKILQEKTKEIDKEIRFIPSSGASQCSTLISLAIPFAEDFVVLLDNDVAGKKAKTKYINEFGSNIERNIHIYKSEKNQFILEDYLSKEDNKNLLRLTKSEDTKRALGFLFYDYKNNQKEFIDNLTKETKENLKDITSRLRKL